MTSNFLECAIYLLVTGIIGFISGRIISAKIPLVDSLIFRCFDFEQDGKIYEKLGIRHWQNRLPDMSRILPFIMPRKKLDSDYKERLPEMIQETCVAELIHLLHAVFGLYCIRLWPNWGGIIFALVNIALFNLPFIVIQRFNRPRLLKIYKRKSQSTKKELSSCAH